MTKIERMRDRRRMEPEKPATPPDNTNGPKLKDFLPSPPSSAGGSTKPKISHQLSNNVFEIPDVEDVNLPFEPFQVNSSSIICPTTPSVAFPQTPDLKFNTDSEVKNTARPLKKTPTLKKKGVHGSDQIPQKGGVPQGGSLAPRGSVVVECEVIVEKVKQVNESPMDTPLCATSEFLEALPKLNSKFRYVSRSPSFPNLECMNVSLLQLVTLEETIGPVVVDQIRHASPAGHLLHSLTYFQLPDTPYTDRTIFSDVN